MSAAPSANPVDTPSMRMRVARFLINVNLVWPFLNAQHFLDAALETNFLFVLAAAALVPEVILVEKTTVLLAIAVTFLARACLSDTSAYLRLVAGLLPLIFLVNMDRTYLRRYAKELIPYGVAHGALVAFLALSVVQFVHFTLVPVIPRPILEWLAVLVPRFMEQPYDDSGVRGVQGWASEPSSAAVTCFAFSVIALRQRPEARLRILGVFALLTFVNRSIYSLVLLALLALSEIARSVRSFRSAVPWAFALGAGLFFVLRMGRVGELGENVLAYGLDETSNRELLRLAQIVYPLAAFPRLYNVETLFDTFVVEPLGLLPLLVGYGSVLGCLVYYRLIFSFSRVQRAAEWHLALSTLLVLSFLTVPHFVPVILAFAYSIRQCDSQSVVTARACDAHHTSL